MFVIELTYIADLTEVERFLAEHITFLERYYAEGCFLASGRKNPRTGGVILAKADSKKDIFAAIEEDPFHKHKIAVYEVTEFIPSKYTPAFKPLLD